MQKINVLAGFLFFVYPAFSQIMLGPDDAIRVAFQHHPLVKAADFELQARVYAEKTALDLPNPEITAESPTGEFYVVGVEQSFAFPTVYARQKQVARAETELARAGQQIGANELRYAVRALYLEAQVAEWEARQWAERDSLYQLIGAAAIRQFAAGEIDFLQKTLVENEAGGIRQNRLAADRQADAARRQLAGLIGLTDLGRLLPLAPDTSGLGPLIVGANPAVAYELQASRVAEQKAGLARSRALPGFSLGYVNQGERDSPLGNRFKAGVGIPLWAGQYRASVRSARAESQAAAARAEAQSRAVALEMDAVLTEAAIALDAVRYHEREALPRSQALISAALRMREAGQTDYLAFLRTLDEAFATRFEYAAQVQNLNAARLRLLYLEGR